MRPKGLLVIPDPTISDIHLKKKNQIWDLAFTPHLVGQKEGQSGLKIQHFQVTL